MCQGEANQHGQEQTQKAQCDVFTTTAKGSIRVDKQISFSRMLAREGYSKAILYFPDRNEFHSISKNLPP